jgi:hypothetical protein
MSNRTLTFTERVAYQRAIEEIYWRHRIWPKENPQPKPPLDAIISQGLLERKVEECLRKSQLVADPRGWPITPSELQAEMDRMARDTKQPDVLRELFVALGNDPFVVAECLAGPKATARQGTADSTAGAIVDVAPADCLVLRVVIPSCRFDSLRSLRTGSDGEGPRLGSFGSRQITCVINL